MNHARVEMRAVSSLRPYERNARTHSKKQVKQIASSIEAFGFTNPVLVTDDGTIIAGHGRVMAAKVLGMVEVPTLTLAHLSPEEVRAYMLADNKLALNAGWDRETLAIELQGLIDFGFDVELTGFSLAEIDLTLDEIADADPAATVGAIDDIPELPTNPVTRLGDVWLLGRHTLVCGDARDPAAYDALLGDEVVGLIFTDPPYNVKIVGNVSGLGIVQHREFAMASGEMTPAQFTEFLTSTLANGAARCGRGAVAFVCMDWRHMREMLDAGEAVFDQLKNLCVWNKTNAGMGTFYRSKHELVFVFKVGKDPHVNSFGLGETGRYRTNVWDYAGANTIGGKRDEELEMHPTVKPVALVADAIRDCSRRGDIVLDVFGGSGSTLIAAESCGRSARLIEVDTAYCDTIITRYQRYTGKAAKSKANNACFDDIAAERS